ncbi:hypothetical protein GOP47_0014302 [Adiantum capillus-veneris]|uniref:Inositol polyphosphate-related phosphatase domain-containing protein n=1 Tax=Adiantum capillus-veneris TaxID=13818 RepID=A0A9D4ULT2_ADICA|nr:hypothetical protein GOP47_0014302 [Adiantum capillus-veneris]
MRASKSCRPWWGLRSRGDKAHSVRESNSSTSLHQMSPWGVTRRWPQSLKSVTNYRHGYKEADATNGSDGTKMEDSKGSAVALNTQQLRLFVGTWNVGGRAPTVETRESVQEWLLHPSAPSSCDIYVLGFQEIVPLNATNILKGNKEDGSNGGILTCDVWEALISETLNKSTLQTHQSTDACYNCEQTIPTSKHMHTRSTLPTKQTQSSHVRDDNSLDTSFRDDARGYALTPSVRVLSYCDKLNLRLQDDEDIQNVPTYMRIVRKQMVGLFITIWARCNLWQHIKNVQVSSVGCGIMNRLGNKGSVSVSLSVHETTLCFICGHLRSGQRADDAIRRNLDVENILHRTRFLCSEKLSLDSSFRLPSSIIAHDRIILLGDLNYRLNIASIELRALLLEQDWKTLFEKDELKDAKGAGGVLEGWREGSICFAPTYKYMIDSDTYWLAKEKEGSNRRAPAWCDRILWHGKGLKQLSYTRCESKHSDHRPVRSTFMVEVEVLEKASSVDAVHDVEHQRFAPFLQEVKELFCTKNIHMKELNSYHVRKD